MTIRSLASLLLAVGFCAAPSVASGADPWTKISAKTLAEMANKGSAVVVVRVEGAGIEPEALQERAIAGLKGRGGFKVRHRYATIPFFIAEVDYAGLGALAGLPEVAGIDADVQVRPSDIESNAVIGATQVQQSYAVTGAGINVAVLDTGVDLGHPDLAGSVAAGRRIMNQGATNDANVQDDQGHGSHVAGIITANGTVAPKGVAPDARLVVVKALGASGGFISDVAAGIDWIVTNNHTFSPPVKFINLSLETVGDLPAQCPCDNLPDFQVLTAAIGRAFDAGIVCIGSAGNDGDTALRYPACLSKVVSVGATFDGTYPAAPAAAAQSPTTGTFNRIAGPFFADCNHTSPVGVDQLVCFTNRNLCMDFVAPGYNITSVFSGSTTQNRSDFGTSQATAHVTAALALLQQAAPMKTPSQLLQLLHDTAVKVPLNEAQPSGAQLDRVDVFAAITRSGVNAADDWFLY